MPVMDGWAFLAEKNQDPALRPVPVIVVSGQRESRTRWPPPAPATFQKPILAAHLIETMEHAGH